MMPKKVYQAFIALLISTVVGSTIAGCVKATQTNNASTSDNRTSAALFAQIPNQDLTPDQADRLSRIRQLPTTASVDLVRVDAAVLQQDQINISLPGIAAMSVKKTGGEVQSDQNFTWLGKIQADSPGSTTLVVRQGQVTGTISGPTGVYRITPLGGGLHAVAKLDLSKFPADEPKEFDSKSWRHTYPQRSKPSTRSDGAPTQIDVLVAYTTSAKASAVPALSNDINSFLQLAVSESNQSYLNSNINLRLNLVDSLEIPYTEGNKDFDHILADFVSMNDIKSRLAQSGADLAVLIINKTDYCGLADAIMATPATAYAIVHFNCATGYYSFAHELGHLMGARHDEQDDPTSQPFTYGHGYRHDPKWRTIMAYDCPTHCVRLQYWSSPNVSYGGETMGTTATNDNARVLNSSAAAVAAFRSKPKRKS